MERKNQHTSNLCNIWLDWLCCKLSVAGPSSGREEGTSHNIYTFFSTLTYACTNRDQFDFNSFIGEGEMRGAHIKDGGRQKGWTNHDRRCKQGLIFKMLLACGQPWWWYCMHGPSTFSVAGLFFWPHHCLTALHMVWLWYSTWPLKRGPHRIKKPSEVN